jgi:CRISPR system Cascade subunit CasB
MWRFYRTWAERSLDAEHHALVLFAVHQQSQRRLVHQARAPLGRAIRQLHAKFEAAAVDRRFFAAATASTLEEVTYHLRQLLRQTHALSHPALVDYTRLYRDLAGWYDPQRRRRAQRRWGLAYYRSPESGDLPAGAPSPEGE